MATQTMRPASIEPAPESAPRKRHRPLTWTALETLVQSSTSKAGKVDHAALGQALQAFLDEQRTKAAPLPTVDQATIDRIAPLVVDAYVRKSADHVVEGQRVTGVYRSKLTQYCEVRADIDGTPLDRGELLATLNQVSQRIGRGLGTLVHIPDQTIKRYLPKGRRR